MNIYIYDIEVFAYDWIVVARRPEEGSPYTVIHNDNYHLREFLNNAPDILGGFNNKHYDDYVVMVMLNGGSNVEVKRCNDFIINGGKPWEFPFIQYQKKPFKSFDLRDDIADPGISLKAIEGNLKLPIVESSVPFDIDRPLTPEELEEVIRYCKYDVDSTVRLYWERKKNYLDAKILAGSIYGIDPLDALGYTNARLSAEALEAKYTERYDERDYVVPEKLPKDKIPKIVLDFFLQIQDKSIPDAKLFGAGKGSKGMTLDLILRTGGGECPVKFAWGGVHGAPPCITIDSDDEYLLFMDDVGSLYPNSKINFGYCSRSMKDPGAYRKLVELRLDFKAKAKKVNKLVAEALGANWYMDYSYLDENGDSHLDLNKLKREVKQDTYNRIEEYLDYDAKQSSLKLIINTCYGAMLSTGNGLNDRLHGRSVCITNQLCMAILITMLSEECKTIWFFNINTDGIGYKIHKSEVEKVDSIIAKWCKITGFTMERTIFKKFIQKDVNNYIGITPDGKFKTKGGYVSLYKGGSFKTNSLSIIHKAIVNNLVKGIDPEVTIRECTEVTAFQQIIKTGGSYKGSYHYVDGERVEVQKVNRVYAVKDPRYGQVVKGKWITEKRKKNKVTGKMDSIPVDPPIWSETVISECPEHCFIDNENTLTIADLDLDYYIDMAKRRIDKYINIDRTVSRKIAKIKKEVVIMATTKETQDPHVMNVYGKLIEARKRFLDAGVKKKGVNRYAEFKYFRLDEIIPTKQEIFREVGLADIITFGNEVATLTIYNVDNPDESIDFMSQLAPDESMIKNPIQKVGAIQTYVRRYLYLLALDIIESDGIEETTDKPVEVEEKSAKTKVKKSNRPATPAEREDTKQELINQDGEATKTQRTAISNGLKKLRARYMDENKVVFSEELEAKYDDYIRVTARTVKAGVTKTEAEDILIDIGKKIAEE
ncbi:hypothetical protein G4926_03515 [Anaerostipes hadrus]|uniref:ERF family protein n=1 Tax=Anaerostipes hadrus TaxID=649756 RepID=UPI00156F49D3|nr:ERF family protein [Anaerostipes hadrus]NSG75582.1 hypothetical protein [Anaerostipes hadrus]